MAAKTAYGIDDSAGDAFKKLVQEIEKTHNELEGVFDWILRTTL